MNFKKLFLPVGLVVALIAAVMLPAAGVWMSDNKIIPVCIITIFLVSGWCLNLKATMFDRKFAAAFVTCIVISLLVGPFIGLGVGKLFGLESAFALGLTVMSSVPVTLSSATVITEVCGGNGAWALVMTIGLNITGIFTVPFMLKFCLEEAEGIGISAWKLLLKLLLLVLLPFVIGYFSRRLLRWKTHIIVKFIPSTCVILTVYAAFAVSSGKLSGIGFKQYPVLLGGVLLVHIILMLLAVSGGYALKLETPERKALMYVTSEKTLPIALSVISIIGVQAGMSLIPCLLFHFTQLIFDSCIAAVLVRKNKSVVIPANEIINK